MNGKKDISKTPRALGKKTDSPESNKDPGDTNNRRNSDAFDCGKDKERVNSSDTEFVFEKVRKALIRISEKTIQNGASITMESSLIEDLGFSSLTFVELTIALERTLEIDAFPMQQWIDEEMTRKNNRFTVRALVTKCVELGANRS